MTLTICLKAEGLRELDFSDDRLAIALNRLGQDESWDAYESEQNRVLLRVYDLKINRVRIDITTAKSYVDVSKDGLFQLGHSKEHRPDLPQIKISQSVLDPLGIPLTTTIVSGKCADDPLTVCGGLQNGSIGYPLLRCGTSGLLPLPVTLGTDANRNLCIAHSKRKPNTLNLWLMVSVTRSRFMPTMKTSHLNGKKNGWSFVP